MGKKTLPMMVHANRIKPFIARTQRPIVAPKIDNIHHENIPPSFFPEEDQMPILGSIPTSDVQLSPVYEAEKILEERTSADNVKQYRVRWRNTSELEDQWIEEKDIQDYKMLENFKTNQSKVKQVRNIYLRRKTS